MIDSDEEVVNEYRYTPFGDTLESLTSFQISIETSSLESLEKNETVYNPYQYTGRRYDNESGLYYYRARMYSPEMARFTSNDPAEQGENWYAYVGNDPVNNRDPSGKWMPTWMINSRPSIPWKIYGITQYHYYPKQALGGGYPGYGKDPFLTPEFRQCIDERTDWEEIDEDVYSAIAFGTIAGLAAGPVWIPFSVAASISAVELSIIIGCAQDTNAFD